jgi:hypothetical protein
MKDKSPGEDSLVDWTGVGSGNRQSTLEEAMAGWTTIPDHRMHAKGRRYIIQF